METHLPEPPNRAPVAVKGRCPQIRRLRKRGSPPQRGMMDRAFEGVVRQPSGHGFRWRPPDSSQSEMGRPTCDRSQEPVTETPDNDLPDETPVTSDSSSADQSEPSSPTSPGLPPLKNDY